MSDKYRIETYTSTRLIAHTVIEVETDSAIGRVYKYEEKGATWGLIESGTVGDEPTVQEAIGRLISEYEKEKWFKSKSK